MDSKETTQTADLSSQEAQYSYPYHYLPTLTPDGFRQHQYWSWGYRYLGRLKIVFDLLYGLEFNTLLDIGCGDGRFLRETRAAFAGRNLLGIDNSERAVSLARQLNPGLAFKKHDIQVSPLDSQWDVITLLEVIEHIPPESLSDFILAAGRLLRPGGSLILTVPHLNEKLISKHYQHFSTEKLMALLGPDFEESGCVLFDNISPFMKVFLRLMGGSGRYWIITHQGLNNLFYKYYIRNCLYGNNTKNCKRIAFTAKKITSETC